MLRKIACVLGCHFWQESGQCHKKCSVCGQEEDGHRWEERREDSFETIYEETREHSAVYDTTTERWEQCTACGAVTERTTTVTRTR